MSNNPSTTSAVSAQPGTARLAVVAPVAVVSFFYASILEYSLPLYFGALSTAAEAAGGSYPADIWSNLVKYQVTPWIVGPVLAGLFAKRYGEKLVWSFALLGKFLVPLLLLVSPDPVVIKLLALWQGFTGALMWIAGISLVQMVTPERKGLSNAIMMTSMGIGSVFGPVLGRALLYRGELADLIHNSVWSSVWSKLFAFESFTTTPVMDDFRSIFWLLTGTTLVCGIIIGLWGQRAGRFEHDDGSHQEWKQTLADLKDLARSPKFQALVIALCVLGGPVFQASNQFLPYRAEDLGLKSGSEDHGWVWLQLLKTLMWIPGGLAVGLLAGRRSSGLAAVMILGSFGVAAFAIGASQAAWQIFTAVAAFEFVRQFMRWSHAGYMSEHMPDRLRATAIGSAITFSGLGSTIYAWAADLLWNAEAADFNSTRPFIAAAILGTVGAAGLLIFDRFRPIIEADSKAESADDDSCQG